MAHEESPEVELREPAVFGGLVGAEPFAVPDVLEVMRDGVEAVVRGSLGVDLAWWTSAITAGDDLERAPLGATGRDGLDWELAASRGPGLASVSYGALAAALTAHPHHPRCRVATVHARWSPGGGTTLGLHLHRWALYGGGADLARVTGLLVPWLLGAAERLGADTGFVTLDRLEGDVLESPWERVVAQPPSLRDPVHQVWGYGWGTLLGPAHLAATDESALAALPGARWVDVAGGRRWLTLGEDPAAVGPEVVAALREVLRPALPTGMRTVEEFWREVADAGSPERYVV